MVFGESSIKDLYRLVVWGPWRKSLELAPDRVELTANRALGRFVAQVLRQRREVVVRHMRAALGDHPEIERWATQVFETHFSNQYVAMTFAKVGEHNWSSYLEWRGRELLDGGLAKGRGVVVAHPHMALPQLPLHVLGLLGYDVHQVGGGRTFVELSAVGRRSAALRASLESRIRAQLHDGKNYLRPLLRVLRGNGVVFTAFDGTGGGEELGRRDVRDVFGAPMAIPVFPAWLAAKTGATLLTLMPRRSERTPFLAEFGPALPSDPDEAVDELARRLEAGIRLSPGDWHFWDQWHIGPGGLLVSREQATQARSREDGRRATGRP